MTPVLLSSIGGVALSFAEPVPRRFTKIRKPTRHPDFPRDNSYPHATRRKGKRGPYRGIVQTLVERGG